MLSTTAVLHPAEVDVPAEVIPEVAAIPAEVAVVAATQAAVIPAAVTAFKPFVKTWRTLEREFSFLLHVV